MSVHTDKCRQLNDHRRLTFTGDLEGRIAYICECGFDDCVAAVRLARAEFDAARVAGRPVVHPSHTAVAEELAEAEPTPD